MVEVRHISEALKSSYLNNEKIEPRKYQVDIANKCVGKNSLVVIPTGLGKTIIAVLVAASTLELFPPECKIIILAPTRPLINQHYSSFINFLTIPEEKYEVLTGKVAPEKRSKLFSENQILFYTPQTLRNDLVQRKYILDNTCLIIFDEAHHASGDYPYTMIADEYLDQNPDGNIIALTASPGSSKEKITSLCKSLHIPVDNIHIRTRNDTDVKTYIKPMDIYKIGVNLTSIMEDVYEALHRVLEQRLQYLSQLGFLEKKGQELYKNIIRKNLLKIHKELISIINGGGDKTGAYGALSVNAQTLILYHMLELVEQQGLDVLLKYFEKMNKDAKKKTSSKAIKILAADYTLRQIYVELKKNEDYSPENLVHPKYQILVQTIFDELNHNLGSRILVFVKLRDSILNITKRLKNYPNIKALRFVGQARKSKEDKGMTQKKQLDALEKFKAGEYNVLVSTNVGEEGLDIAECDLVIFYDVVASEIRLIQRKGRTARHREGKVVILYCKGTNDEKYLWIALNKLKKMNINLKNPKELRKYYEKKESELAFKEKQAFPIEEGSNIAKYKIQNRKRQSNLQSFISDVEEKKANGYLRKIVPIKLSIGIPMKLGLRKKLGEEGIEFKVGNFDVQIDILSKVCILYYNPKDFSKVIGDKIIQKNLELKKTYDLVLTIFDFIDYEENFEGEKRLLKKEVQNFGNSHNVKVIIIDNSEELFFIVKSIYEQSKKEGT